MQKFISFLTGAILGALVGATLALIFAPDSGEGTRANLQGRFSSIQIEVREAASARRAALEEQLQILKTPRKSE